MIEVVGIPASGWTSLGEPEREVVASADVLIGSPRQLDLVPASSAERRDWPRPMMPGLADFLAPYGDRRVVVLASGDPMLAGIGTTLVDLLGIAAVNVHPAVSSVALARARLGWSEESTTVVRLIDVGAAPVRPLLVPGRRVIVLSRDETSPRAVAAVLTDAGWGGSRMIVLSDLGAAKESRIDRVAVEARDLVAPRLNLVCVECVADGARGADRSLVPGLPDDAFDHDGQLSKRDLRASALARLRPTAGELLWDLGAGAGSVAVEWTRSTPGARAIAVERDAVRAERIRANARRLGAAGVDVIVADSGAVAVAVADSGDVVVADSVVVAGGTTLVDQTTTLPRPDAVFIGGGVSAPLIERVWSALRPGGRLVVHAVTLETEMIMIAAWRTHGGELHRIAVEELSGLGSFHGWKPARSIVQWAVTVPTPLLPHAGAPS